MATVIAGGNLLTNNDQVRIDTGNCTSFSATVTGTFVGTITFQILYDATEGWVAAPCFSRAGVAASAVLTAPGNRFINAAGATAVRALFTPYTSGSAECTFCGVPAISATAAAAGGGGASTIADGADAAEGATTDVKVTGDNPGSLSAKSRGLLYEVGDQADAAAGTDAGTFSLFAFVKRLLAKLTAGLPLKDGVTANLATVAAFHAADNQSPGGTAFGLLTGGVAQLLNAQGRLDRQQETGRDNITSIGVVTGTQQLKSPVSTTVTAGGGAASTAVTLAATKFVNRGSSAWIGVGTALTFEPGTANQETGIVTAVNYGTNVVTVWVGSGVTNTGLTFTHANGSAVTAGAYNEARDATTPDGSTGAGFAAGATYLFNSTLNAGTGGWESERSFLGELSGATGAGSAIAQEYEDTAGGPILASGLASGLRLTPAQSLQGKGRQTATVTSTVAGNTNLVFASAAATNLVMAGWPILLTGSGVTEVVFTTATWVPGSSATVPLQSPVVNTAQVTAAWDSYAPNGPGLLGFLPTGIGIEEEALFNPADLLYYVERSHTGDGIALANVVSEGVIVYDGTGNATGGQRLRTPAVFKTATATALGNTALWTPAGGKKFRLLRYLIEVSANASLAAGAVLTVDLVETGTAPGVLSQTHSVFIPTAAVTTTAGNALSTGWVDLGNGYLSTNANNLLQVNLSAALATGICRVLVAGTEE